MTGRRTPQRSWGRSPSTPGKTIPKHRRERRRARDRSHRGGVRPRLLDAMRARDGVITRSEALTIAAPHVVDKAIRAGAVVRVFPSVLVLAELASDPMTIDRAAVCYVQNGALSHTTALRLHRIPHETRDARCHVTMAPGSHIRQARGSSSIAGRVSRSRRRMSSCVVGYRSSAWSGRSSTAGRCW